MTYAESKDTEMIELQEMEKVLALTQLSVAGRNQSPGARRKEKNANEEILGSRLLLASYGIL